MKKNRLKIILISLLVFLLIYSGGYLILRFSSVRAYRSDDMTFEYGTFFDKNSTIETGWGYIYIPLGFLDFFITGHRYWISEDTYLYDRLDSNAVRAYIADKNNKNNKASYAIIFDDNSKTTGIIGYLDDPFLELSHIIEKYGLEKTIKAKNGSCEIEIETLTSLEGDTKTLHKFEFKNGKLNGSYILSYIQKDASYNVFECSYKNGMREGRYILRLYNDTVAEGIFKEDKPFEGQFIIEGNVIEYKEGNPLLKPKNGIEPELKNPPDSVPSSPKPLSSCAKTKPKQVEFIDIRIGVPTYKNPNEFSSGDYRKIFAIVEVDDATFNKAKADRKAILIKEINGQIHYSVEEQIEFDFPEQNIRNAWCPVLYRYRVKK